MRKIWEIVGSNICLRRKSLKMSQKELGRLAGGLSALTINRYEKARQQPSKANISAVAKALGCTVDELYKDELPPSQTIEELALKITEQHAHITNLESQLDTINSALAGLKDACPDALEKLRRCDNIVLRDIAQLLKASVQSFEHHVKPGSHKSNR